MYQQPTSFISSKESLLAILVNSGCIDDSGHDISSSDNESGELPDLKIVPVHINYRVPPIPFEAGVLSLKVGLMLPAYRGSMSLASENPFDRPTCALNFLSDPADFAVTRKGIKLTKRTGVKMREQGMKMADLYMPDSESDVDLDSLSRKQREPLTTMVALVAWRQKTIPVLVLSMTSFVCIEFRTCGLQTAASSLS
ncbi:hypothetical protein CVT25_001187 [Psilocybe cyanescens]|uniref:Glucose-methanol-choline oxidoreductase C-terminal domain-containing protein n=1 Tax=Psilocybe cyanescens TaxID=93625 RepID=A0A409XME0_PSICY|nr:hypothetical protein CVT25_001187 [Psilocybe cyanescens]